MILPTPNTEKVVYRKHIENIFKCNLSTEYVTK